MSKNPALKQYAYYTRQFLNLEGYHAGAHVLVKVNETQGGEYPTLDASFTIMDCARVITLDFDTYSLNDIANTLHKLETFDKIWKDFKKTTKKELKKLEKHLKED